MPIDKIDFIKASDKVNKVTGSDFLKEDSESLVKTEDKATTPSPTPALKTMEAYQGISSNNSLNSLMRLIEIDSSQSLAMAEKTLKHNYLIDDELKVMLQSLDYKEEEGNTNKAIMDDIHSYLIELKAMTDSLAINLGNNKYVTDNSKKALNSDEIFSKDYVEAMSTAIDREAKSNEYLIKALTSLKDSVENSKLDREEKASYQTVIENLASSYHNTGKVDNQAIVNLYNVLENKTTKDGEKVNLDIRVKEIAQSQQLQAISESVYKYAKNNIIEITDKLQDTLELDDQIKLAELTDRFKQGQISIEDLRAEMDRKKLADNISDEDKEKFYATSSRSSANEAILKDTLGKELDSLQDKDREYIDNVMNLYNKDDNFNSQELIDVLKKYLSVNDSNYKNYISKLDGMGSSLKLIEDNTDEKGKMSNADLIEQSTERELERKNNAELSELVSGMKNMREDKEVSETVLTGVGSSYEAGEKIAEKMFDIFGNQSDKLSWFNKDNENSIVGNSYKWLTEKAREYKTEDVGDIQSSVLNYDKFVKPTSLNDTKDISSTTSLNDIKEPSYFVEAKDSAVDTTSLKDVQPKSIKKKPKSIKSKIQSKVANVKSSLLANASETLGSSYQGNSKDIVDAIKTADKNNIQELESISLNLDTLPVSKSGSREPTSFDTDKIVQELRINKKQATEDIQSLSDKLDSLQPQDDTYKDKRAKRRASRKATEKANEKAEADKLSKERARKSKKRAVVGGLAGATSSNESNESNESNGSSDYGKIATLGTIATIASGVLATGASMYYMGSEMKGNYDQYQMADNDYDRDEALARSGGGVSGAIAGGLAGAEVGGMVGAWMGTLAMPLAGTVIGATGGAVVGGIVGAGIGMKMGAEAADYIHETMAGPLDKIPDDQRDNPFTAHEYLTNVYIPKMQEAYTNETDPEKKKEIQNEMVNMGETADSLLDKSNLTSWMEDQIDKAGLSDESNEVQREFLTNLMSYQAGNELFYNAGMSVINDPNGEFSDGDIDVGNVMSDLWNASPVGVVSNFFGEKDETTVEQKLQKAADVNAFNNNNTLGKNGTKLTITAGSNDENFKSFVNAGIVNDDWGSNSLGAGAIPKLSQMPVAVVEGLLKDGNLNGKAESEVKKLIAEMKDKKKLETSQAENGNLKEDKDTNSPIKAYIKDSKRGTTVDKGALSPKNIKNTMKLSKSEKKFEKMIDEEKFLKTQLKYDTDGKTKKKLDYLSKDIEYQNYKNQKGDLGSGLKVSDKDKSSIDNLVNQGLKDSKQISLVTKVPLATVEAYLSKDGSKGFTQTKTKIATSSSNNKTEATKGETTGNTTIVNNTTVSQKDDFRFSDIGTSLMSYF